MPLYAQLDFPLPEELSIGSGTAVFACGWCFSPQSGVRRLSLVVNGDEQAMLAFRMPRRDVFRAHHPGLDPIEAHAIGVDSGSPEDPLLHSWRSGFWGVARVAPRSSDDPCDLLLRAELADGSEAVAELGRIPMSAQPEPLRMAEPARGDGPLVAVCMATYSAPPDLLARQLESIRAQTHPNWICIISDDRSSLESFAMVRRAVGDDPRFFISRSPRRLGFYRNFERALSMVPPSARYVAMADQDDYWHPDKLAVLLAEIGDARLAYSDARIVRRDGEPVSDTFWNLRQNNYRDLDSVLVANSVAGAGTLFDREVLDYALPFPPAQFAHFHDHWIALTALALGDIAFIKRPLYDYVQHGAASLGHARSNMMTTLRDRIGSVRRDPRQRVRLWRYHYFVDVCRLMQVANILQMRCDNQMSAPKRRALERFLHSDGRLFPWADLGLRGARELLGLSKETLGAEWMLFHALAWPRLLNLTSRPRLRGRLPLDAVPPATLVPRPEHAGLEDTAAGAIALKIAPLELDVRADAPPRVNLLVPTIDLEHFFGGYIAKFNLARRLAERGIRTRVVTVDPVGPLPRSWRRRLESYNGLTGVLDRIEIAFGRESAPLEVSPSDRFIATTWWTAHIARSAVGQLGGERFLYMIQEFEPFTFPMGTYAALAHQSYEFPHVALFSTELLRDYFRRHGIGVYAHSQTNGEAISASFQNAITAIDPPPADELASRRLRRVLFYARPELHAARNMFELGVLALRGAVDQGAIGPGWEVNGIGSLDAGGIIGLGQGLQLRLLPRAEQRAHGETLRGHDIGLALMYTPHPSLVPIEMASAGMLTVTNAFENKTADKMAEISTNLITESPTVEGITAGLIRAADAVADVERRVRGTAVRWSRDWNESFGDELVTWLASALELDGV